MNRIITILILVFLICCEAFLYSSCDKDYTNPELINIEIKIPPAKLEYYVGDILDLSGIVITLIMNNGTTEDVEFSDFESKGITCSPINETELNDTTTEIIITHTNSSKSVIQSITVSDIVVAFSIKIEPTKVEYYLGESLDLSGLILTLTMDNGATKDVTFSDFTSEGINCFPENGDKLLDTLSVNITHIISGLEVIQNLSYFKLIDIDYNKYSLAKIGNQIWMAENLKTSHYANGTAIPDGTGIGDISSQGFPKYWFVYKDDIYYKESYGFLYTWEAVMNGSARSNSNPSGVQGVCPAGWHVPSDNEWEELVDYLGGVDFAISQLKGSGFSVIFSGIRYQKGTFGSLDHIAYYWTTTDYDIELAYTWELYSNGIEYGDNNKSNGLSVRCIKN